MINELEMQPRLQKVCAPVQQVVNGYGYVCVVVDRWTMSILHGQHFSDEQFRGLHSYRLGAWCCEQCGIELPAAPAWLALS